MDDMTSVEGRRRPRSPVVLRRAAFSLIELLLVVAISLIAAGIAVPLFARSFKGSQLRGAARTVVMSAKYARSMSVLQQRQMALLFDRVTGGLEIVTIADRRALGQRDLFLEARSTRAADQVLQKSGDADTPATSAASDGPIRTDVIRSLGRDVRIVGFETERADQVLDGIYWVNYYPNGMSDGFEIRLADPDGREARVEVDGISGAARVDYR